MVVTTVGRPYTSTFCLAPYGASLPTVIKLLFNGERRVNGGVMGVQSRSKELRRMIRSRFDCGSNV